jgi:hypothetical protein
VHSEIEEADETQLLFGISNRGISFIYAAKPSALPSSVPSFASAPAAQPSQGPYTGGTATILAGQNLESTAQLKFGQQLATPSIVSPAQIQATAPPSVINGAVDATAYFPSGWLAIAPDAFSYGPQILEILPNAGPKAGGDAIQIYGYGFGSDATQITAKIGGGSAIVQNVEDVPSIDPSLALDSTYPFPLQRITLLTPPGTPGQADVTIISTAGATTSARAFQFTQSAQVFAKPGLYKFILYDQKRQSLYLSATDHVDVFDLSAAQFHATAMIPPGGPPPNAPRPLPNPRRLPARRRRFRRPKYLSPQSRFRLGHKGLGRRRVRLREFRSRARRRHQHANRFRRHDRRRRLFRRLQRVPLPT